MNKGKVTFAKFLIVALCGGALLTGIVAGSRDARADDAATSAVAIKDFAFTPRILTVHAGSKVTWVNKDEEPHKLVQVNEAFKSQPLDTDGAFTFQFDTPGTYEYFCALHPRMTGKIIVEK